MCEAIFDIVLSIVGPRPQFFIEEVQYTPEQLHHLDVKARPRPALGSAVAELFEFGGVDAAGVFIHTEAQFVEKL